MMTPFIFEKTKDGEVLYDVFSRLVKDRIIFLAGEKMIDNDSATTVAASMLWLDSQSKKPINLYINSAGGIVQAGLFTILDTMNSLESPIHTTCIGEASSAAAVILAAGEKGERRAYPNAEIMIHDVNAGIIGPAHEIKKTAQRIDLLNERLAKLLSKFTKQSEAKVKLVMKEETFFSAEEAVKFGLIDKVIGAEVKPKR